MPTGTSMGSITRVAGMCQESGQKLPKPINEEVDAVATQHYGLTDEVLDSIINYDIKYRMGR